MESVSLLTNLEPSCGVCFALSLAYIGLPRFRYRLEIKQHAQARLQTLEGNPDSHPNVGSYKKTSWYAKVAELAQNGEHKLPSASSQTNGSREVWEVFYGWIFKRRIDRLAISIGCTLAVILIFMGVGHQISAWPTTLIGSWFDTSLIALWYWLTTIFTVIPVLSVWLGRLTVDGACSFVDKHINDHLVQMQQQVPEAPDPTAQQQA